MYRRYWVVKIETNGFESIMLLYGTEEEMQNYMASEIGYVPGYHGATNEELEAARFLRIKAYICPEIR